MHRAGQGRKDIGQAHHTSSRSLVCFPLLIKSVALNPELNFTIPTSAALLAHHVTLVDVGLLSDVYIMNGGRGR